MTTDNCEDLCNELNEYLLCGPGEDVVGAARRLREEVEGSRRAWKSDQDGRVSQAKYIELLEQRLKIAIDEWESAAQSFHEERHEQTMTTEQIDPRIERWRNDLKPLGG